jgi:hypothetical protein
MHLARVYVSVVTDTLMVLSRLFAQASLRLL